MCRNLERPEVASMTHASCLRYTTYPSAGTQGISVFRRASEKEPWNGTSAARPASDVAGRRDSRRGARACHRTVELGALRLREHDLLDERRHALLLGVGGGG